MIVGVMGKIASGKSEIMRIFEEKGFFCIDADRIVHDLYQADGEGSKRIAAVFGDDFVDSSGAVDRVALRNEVFADENKLKLLNNIIHPIVFEEIINILSRKKENVAIEAVYFDQNFLDDFVDKLIWVERPMEEIRRILLNQRNFPSELVDFAIDSIKKPKEVDLVVNNVGSKSDLRRVVEECFFV